MEENSTNILAPRSFPGVVRMDDSKIMMIDEATAEGIYPVTLGLVYLSDGMQVESKYFVQKF